MVAVLHGSVSVIDRYLQAGAQVDAQTWVGRTTLHYIAWDIALWGWSFSAHNYERIFEKSETIDMLLSAGTDPSIRDKFYCACTPCGLTPLTYIVTGLDRLSIHRGNICPWLLEWFVLVSQRSWEVRITSTVAEFVRIRDFENLENGGLTHVCCKGANSFRHPFLTITEGIGSVGAEEQ